MRQDFDHDRSEFDWKNQSAAREIAEARQTARDMEDVELWTPRPCCDDPANFRCISNLNRCPDTGYFEGNFYECQTCGSRIGEQDYALIVMWANRLESEPDAVPPEIDRETRIQPGKVA